ncbi:MAG: HDOD domain-containing protein [Gammaproteobacteria bacterium]|nr:HDOD domain-containing protein [Gammaproteobacteria bacterium]
MLELLLKQAGELPSLPEVYIRVTELLETETSTAAKIGAAVQTDPTLTARILKQINSAYFGLRNPVTSIPQAVILLGRQQLQQVMVGSVLSGVFKDFGITAFPLRDFWQHCVKTAIIARQLAMQNGRIIDHEAFFTAGLLHDIGWLVIAKVNPGSYIQINEIAKAEHREIIEVEADKFGVTHIEVGVALLEKWGIPGLITQCVKKHHESVHIEPYKIETAIVYLANQLSHIDLSSEEFEEEKEEAIPEFLSGIPNWEQSKCTLEQIGIACRLADEQWLEVMESLGMVDLDIDDKLEESFLFNTDLDRL